MKKNGGHHPSIQWSDSAVGHFRGFARMDAVRDREIPDDPKDGY